MFAPVNTLRELTFPVVMLADAVFTVRILALKMFASVVTESWVILAPVNTLRVLTLSVVMLAEAVLSVSTFALKRFVVPVMNAVVP